MGETENTIDIDYLRQRLRYEPETGKLYWLNYEGMPKWWSIRYAGKEAFTARNGQGYKHGRFCSVTVRSHRVAWALHYGEWPAEQIDHINGVRDDNRIANLRAVSNQENQKNAKKQSNNTSGVVGVSWVNAARKWQVRINTPNKTQHYLGLFDTLEGATKARKGAEIKYGYHENHGRS